MNFIAIIMIPSLVSDRGLEKVFAGDNCPVSTRMHLIFVNVILLDRAGMIGVGGVSMGGRILVGRLFTLLALLFGLSFFLC